MGNSVTLYATGHDALDNAKGADDESVWPIRDRRHDVPALLWIACFREADINLETEVGEDGRKFDDAYFFAPIDSAISNLSKRVNRIREIFSRNEGVDLCIEDMVEHLSSEKCASLYLPIRLYDWHKDATAWTLETLALLDSAEPIPPNAAEWIAARYDFHVVEKGFFSTKWLPFFTPQQLDEAGHPKKDWDRTGGLIGWDEF